MPYLHEYANYFSPAGRTKKPGTRPGFRDNQIQSLYWLEGVTPLLGQRFAQSHYTLGTNTVGQ